MDIQRYNDTLKGAMRAKGMKVAQLTEATNITQEYINALLERDIDSLPATPYVHGYLKILAEVLELDFDALWEEFQAERHRLESGSKDRLPINRFAPKPLNKKMIIIGLVVIIGLVLLIPQLADFLGKPSLDILVPESNNNETALQQFTIKGQVGNPQDKVMVNGDEALVTEDGTFQKEVYLEEGMNTFHIIAKRLLGRETTITRNIFYTPPPTPTAPPATSTPITNG